ncbi:hypothetical protein [Brevibacillus thermoruber]|uniref:hypothetical protein n=1 Tax=Brevibacillus thermoruber TaxID=33942 RepID=UPI00054E524D|nr:hypothetical protein [Brevibacillus thermoruber]
MKKGLIITVTASLAVLTGSLVYSQMGKPQIEQPVESPLTTASSSLDGYGGVENAQPVESVQEGGTTKNGVTYGGIAWGGLVVGYTGKYKKITGSSQVLIPRLGGDTYGLIETNVTVKRLGYDGKVAQTLTGKALVFASTRDTADSGYVMVSQGQAQQWVKVLNGNPAYVFDPNRSNIYSYKIKNAVTGDEFIAYNLADIASACGGAGDPPAGDGLTKVGDDLYMKKDGFIATPRPYGGISVSPASTTRSFSAAPSSASSLFAAASLGPMPKYVDESGKKFADIDEVVLVFGGVDSEKSLPMVFSKTSNKIYGVKKLDKGTATITVGDQIGEVIRTDNERIYFKLTIFPELQGKELSIKQPQ